MRFRRLAIPAYGPFTGLELEFPDAGGDFHLIYGRNEAGKSSLLRAIRDLLYGIPAQTGDDFRHAYKDLRITAEIENRAGQRLAFQRRKGNRSTLLDDGDAPLDDAALAPFLGPVGRDFFTTMFGLGTHDLRQGAADLLQGKGDLGQALFSASLAGTPVHRVLARLEAEAQGIFNGRARVGIRLRPALDAYSQALHDSKQAQVKPETWEEILAELARATQAKDELDAVLATLRARQDWLRRCLDALPTLGRLQAVEEHLAALPALPTLPAGFATAAATTRAALQQTRDRHEELQRRHDDLVRRHDTLAPRAEVLARSADIEVLVQGLAVYRQDRNTLMAERDRAEQQRQILERGLRDLGQEGELDRIADLAVPLEAQLALRQAAAALQEAQRRRAEHEAEAARLAGEIEKASLKLGRLPAGDVAALRAAQTATAAAAALGDRQPQLEALARRRDSQQRLLPGAPADAAATYALELPSAARLREFAEAHTGLTNRDRQLEEVSTRSAQTLRELHSRLDRLELRGALPTRADLDAARAHRDAGWRRALDAWRAGEPVADWDGASLAETYPAAVRQADHLADRLGEEADAVAQADELRLAIREAQARSAELDAARVRLESDRQAWQADWQALWQASGLTPASPAAMLEWREAWSEFRSRHEAWRELDAAVTAETANIATAVALLRPLLDSADKPLAELRTLAEKRLRAADRDQGSRATLEVQLAEFRDAAALMERQRPALEAELARSQACWQQHPLGGEQTPETALPLLEARLALVAQHDEWVRLTAAVARKQAAVADYESRVQALASIDSAATAGSTFNAEVTIATLRDALAEARDLDARRRQVAEDLAEAAAQLPRATQAAAAATADLEALLARAGVADLAELDALLADLARREQLLADRAALIDALHVPARGEPLESFLVRVGEEDAATLAVQIIEQDARIQEVESRREQAIQDLARAQDARRQLEASGAAAAEHLQHARHTAAGIGRDAARYLRLHLAIRFLKDQIEAFRASNQGPLLARAGDLFSRMTAGSFAGLGSDYGDDDVPTLVGLKAGARVPVAGMSEGSRDQLYLALRLAALEQHQARHEPMPLILDDLLITFDDDRARQILPLLRDLPGQVLLFTHHRHLLDLAREALAGQGAQVHEL